MSDHIEVTAWRKSSRSESGHCVEAGDGSGVVGVRDSKDPAGPVLKFTPGAWTRFIQETGLLAGR